MFGQVCERPLIVIIGSGVGGRFTRCLLHCSLVLGVCSPAKPDAGRDTTVVPPVGAVLDYS